jgi:hypothetical protein
MKLNVDHYSFLRGQSGNNLIFIMINNEKEAAFFWRYYFCEEGKKLAKNGGPGLH